jgi:kynurenine formamidase
MRWFAVTAILSAVLPLCASLPTSERRPTTETDVEHWMEELSNWGRWGPNDQMGTINLITTAKRKQAAALVSIGVSVSLAHDDSTQRAPDNNPPFGHAMLTLGSDPSSPYAMDRYTETLHGFGITHLDALCHMYHGDTLYNGFPRDSVTMHGAQKLAVIQMKNGLFTRGVMMDIPRLKGLPYLEPEEAIYPEDLEAWEKKAGVRLEPGDVVLIRTGRWARRQKLGPWNIASRSAGLHATCAPWLHQRDIAVLGSDAASDVLPSGVAGLPMPIHLLSLVAMGLRVLGNPEPFFWVAAALNMAAICWVAIGRLLQKPAWNSFKRRR